MVVSLNLASLIIKLVIVIKLLVSGIATHSHKTVWSWCAMSVAIYSVLIRVSSEAFICVVEFKKFLCVG